LHSTTATTTLTITTRTTCNEQLEALHLPAGYTRLRLDSDSTPTELYSVWGLGVWIAFMAAFTF